LEIAVRSMDMAAPARGRWPFLQTLGWGVIIVIVSAVIQGLIFGAIAIVDLYGRNALTDLSPQYLAQTMLFQAGRGDVVFAAIIVSNLVCVAAILLIVLLKGHTLKAYLSLHTIRASTLLAWMLILAGFVILAEGTAAFFGVDFGGDTMTNLYKAMDSLWLFWVAAVLAAPLFEEVMFRGFLFRGFQASILGTGGTVVLTALLWAALHIQYNLYGMGFIAATGILFGIARAWTGSLIVPMALHAALNFSDLLLFSMGGS
jgi:membrane protease YdiL (CAAX protease family)